MNAKELRQRFLSFFESKGHKIIPSAPLVPTEKVEFAGTQRVLFTTAGMHPLIPYLLGETHPEGKRLTNVQKCLRTDDIDEVGDNTHGTFFEMLGNWSLGDYWKKEAIKWSFEFLTKELNLDPQKIAVSVFAGDSDAPFDSESFEIWKSLGVPEERIAKLGKKDNWWGPVGNSGPCGPDTEMFIWTGEGRAPEEFDPENSNWVEVWNDVFMQYNKAEDGSFLELSQKNVDTGMGLERTVAVLNGKKSAYETDLFEPIIKQISLEVKKSYYDEENKVLLRIIADHLKAAVFLVKDGIVPSNKMQGYVLRRLLRRAAVKIYQLLDYKNTIAEYGYITDKILEVYDGIYDINFSKDRASVAMVIDAEMTKFNATLGRGLKEVEKIQEIDGKKAFDLYQTFGFPYEVTEEIFRDRGQEINKAEFKSEFEKHQELSRTASVGMFKGGLAGHSEIETKYHTATHLLHQALRDVLGPEVFQKGSNINQERLRFDFSFDRKMTDWEIKKVEEIVNERIKQDLKVDRKFMSVEAAKKMNAIGLFNDKYAEQVSIYVIGPMFKLDPNSKDQRDRGSYYSAEFCGGPHVESTAEIGGIKITKEEAISAGIRRIRAELK